MKKLRILVACEESQAVTKEFRALGHDAFSCDILPESGGHPEWHIQGDVLPLLKQQWDLIVAFPPCTDLAVSGAAWFSKKRASGSQREAIEFFMKFVHADCDFICIENPVGILSGKYIKEHFPDLCEKYNLPLKPTQTIEPYFFGDPANKKTCLWLKGLPKLAHDPKDHCQGSTYVESKSGKRYPDWCWNTGGGSGNLRSKTFPGIAKAIAEQWSDFLTKEPV